MNVPRRHALRCLCAAVFSSGFLLAGPPLSAQQLRDDSPRLRWFQDHKDSYDVVFIGSSRVYHGLSPKLFDQIAARAGHHWRAFNLGVDRMKTPGCLAVARKVIAAEPAKLKYLFFELQARTGAGAPKPDAEVSEREVRSGAGVRPIAFAPSRGLGPDGDGFNPLEKNMKPEFRPVYEQRLQMAKEHSAPRAPDPVMRDELSQLVKELAAKNIQVIFVVAPSLRAARGSGADAPPGSMLFSFDDLTRYAPLYDEANRPDAEHLNARGAEIFTRDLAQQFLHALDSAAR